MKSLGVLLVATTYFYFLLFAQFAFLEIAKSHLAGNAITIVMAVMGVSGMLGSLFTARLVSTHLPTKVMEIGLLVCGFTGFISSYAASVSFLIFISFLIGFGLSMLTVSLACSLCLFIPKKNIGKLVGLGTGCAYFICNIPVIFTAPPVNQGLLVGVASIIILVFLKTKSKSFNNLYSGVAESEQKKSQNLKPFIVFLLTFLALVWFDSSAFYVIQTAGELKSATWQEDSQLWRNAFIHFFSALLAGLLIDKGRISLVLILAFIFLALGVCFVQSVADFRYLAAPFYCSGVSFYSTALVVFPSLFSEQTKISRAWIAGLLYAVAGWFGSAMGIGMAQDLKMVPILFIVMSGAVVFSNYFIQRKLA